jgi:hypothetical protein
VTDREALKAYRNECFSCHEGHQEISAKEFNAAWRNFKNEIARIEP